MSIVMSDEKPWQCFFGQCQSYLTLCKPKVVALMVFTAWVGMALAMKETFAWQSFVFGSLGIAMMAGAAAALNHIIDRRIDAIMHRTKARPLPKGDLSVTRCLVFSMILGLLGFYVLYAWVNPLTAWLTFASLIGYAVIYTMYLKRATPQNIVIGGLAGATPPLLGWTSITGEVSAYALVLALIIFAWTPPHFWALAIYRKEDYAKVGIPMLPVTHGDDFTRLHILFYTILMVLVTLLPFVIGENGVFYLIGALLLGAGFLYHSLLLYLTKSRRVAIKTFVFSIVYLFGLFAFLLIDRFLPVLNGLFI